jgi:hypothetical protein
MESWQQLVQLVERLPPDKAQKLRELLNSPDFKNVAAEGFAQIIRTLDLRSSDAGGPGPETLMRRVCKLLEPFLVNAAEEDEDGVIGRPTLMLWWKAAKAEMRHLGELERRFAETLGGGDEAAAAAIGVEAAEALARQALTLTIKNGPRTATQDVRRIAVALAGGAALLDDLERLGLSGPVTSRNRIAVSAPLLESFPGVYAKAAEMQRYDPVWLVHAAMNRLERPWEALLVVNAIHSAGAKGLRLEDTELAPVVQRVISLLRQLSDQSVAAIKSAARTPTTEKLRETEAITAKYFDAAEMITQQIKIERDSAWGRVFLLLRKTVSEVVADTIETFEDVLVDFVEGWDETEQALVDNAKARHAAAAVDLLAGWRARADRHGFATAMAAFDRRTQALLARSMGRSEQGKDLWQVQKRRLLEAFRYI